MLLEEANRGLRPADVVEVPEDTSLIMNASGVETPEKGSRSDRQASKVTRRRQLAEFGGLIVSPQYAG